MKTDAQLKAEVERAVQRVESGWVWLDGELDGEYQRRAARDAVRTLTGLVGVRSDITLRPRVAPTDVKRRILDALARHAERKARHIDVDAAGATVTLRGRVDSLAGRAAVQGAAWSAPGIASVINEMRVGPAG